MPINQVVHMFSPKDCIRDSVWKKEKSGTTITKRLVCKECGKEIAFTWDENGEEKMFVHGTFNKLKNEIKQEGVF